MNDAPRDALLDLARNIAKQARKMGADEAAISVTRSTEVSLMRRAGKLEQATQATSLGVSLALLVEDRYSVHSTSDLRPDALRSFLERAISATRVLEPEPERRQAPLDWCGRGATAEQLDVWDANQPDITAEQRRVEAEALEAAVDALPERGRVKSATVFCGDSASETARVMTNGFEGMHRATGFGHGAEMTLEEPGGRRPEGYAYFAGTHHDDLPGPEHVAKECWRRTAQRLDAGPAPSGRYPMLLDAQSVGRILGVLGGPLAGSELHQGRSFLAGREGTRIASPKLTILDDPFIPRGLASRPWDGDGLVAKRFPVIEDGVLKNFYLGLYYSRKLGMPATTGGRSNWVVPHGTRSPEEILRDLPRAIVVNGFLGGNSNGLTGDFSFGIQGLLVEHGEVVAHLSEMNVSGNIGEVLERFTEAGNDVWRYGALRSGSLLFDDVPFSGK